MAGLPPASARDIAPRTGPSDWRPGVLAALAPVLMLEAYKAFLAKRPFWARFYDPEMLYFFGSLRIADGRSPYPVETPGGPLHLLGVPLVFLTGRDPLAIDAFRLLAYTVLVLLTAGAAFLVNRWLLREVPPILQAAAVWVFFCAPAALEYAVIWSPEALYFAVGSIALVCLAAELRSQSDLRLSLLTGLVLGLCVATKFTFVAWLPAYAAAVVAARGIRGGMVSAATAAAGSVAGFAIAAAPILGNLPAILASIARFQSSSGAYGSGARGAPTIAEIAETISLSVGASRTWHALGAVILIGALIAAARIREIRPLVVFAVVATAMTYALAIRYMPPRYLLTNGLTMLVLFSAASRAIRRGVVAWVAAMVVLAILVKSSAADLRLHHTIIADAKMTKAAIETALLRGGRSDADVVIFGWRAPWPSFALRILARDDGALRRIESRWPREGHYNGWDRELFLPSAATGWDYAVVSDEDAQQLGGVRIARVRGFSVLAAR